jgi:hypothetical protein
MMINFAWLIESGPLTGGSTSWNECGQYILTDQKRTLESEKKLLNRGSENVSGRWMCCEVVPLFCWSTTTWFLISAFSYHQFS